MEKALAFLRECGVFYLATSDENQPHVRPFGAVCGHEGRLYFITNNQKKVFTQIRNNPRVEISGMAGQKWIRIEAEAVIDDSRAARVAMLEANPSLGSMYSADDGVMAVFYLKNATAAICSCTDAPEAWQF